MATYTYPGVYVEEIPPQVRPIAGVGTSTAAFLGLAEKGRIDEPIKLFNFQEFKNEFGDFLSGSYLAHGVYHFFNNGGRECYVIRLGPGATPDSWAFVDKKQANPDVCLRVEAKSPSELQLTIEAEIPVDDPNLFTLRVYEGTPTNTTTRPEADQALTLKETHENVSMSPQNPNYVGLVTARSEYVAVEVDLSAAIIESGYTQGKYLATLEISATDKHRKFRIQVDDSATVDVEIGAGAFTLNTVRDALEVALDALTASGTLPSVTVGLQANPTANTELAVKITSDTPGNNSRVAVFSYPDLDQDAAGILGFLGDGVVQYHGASANRPNATVAASGNDPGRQVPARIDGAEPGATVSTPDYQTALELLDGIDDVSLIAIPGVGETAVVDVATNYCRNRQLSDCFFIADMRPDQTELTDAEEWRSQVNASDYGAAYFPWLSTVDPHPPENDLPPKSITVPPSGFVAGIYARTDEARGVWKAPAGIATTVAGTLGVVTELTDQQHGNLNVGDKAIDVIRRFPNVGTVVWGARTLAMESDPHRYIPVRRTAIFLKRSIYNGIQWAVFEPNGEQLWASLRANVGAFMNGLFRAGAFQGARASEAYFVECGKDRTMTQTDIDLGKVIVEVGFAPLKPAEFVIVRIQQIVQQ